MADVTPGVNTSEGKLAIVATILSVGAAIIPPLWTAFSNLKDSFPQVTWIAAIVSVLGVLGTIVTALGYGGQRAQVKVTALKADAVSAPDPK